MPALSGELGSAQSSYEILARLATGGMAEIYLARAVSTTGVERYVVLKRILSELAKDRSFVDMFLDEARLAAQLQHQNIAQVHDIGRLGESLFFTMEYVHGETVRDLVISERERHRPLPISAVLAIAAGAAAGLHHAHGRVGHDGAPLGIVHRDVSPSNLMVSYEGAVKLVDFGVAKAEHRSHRSLHGTVKGKVTYMSPEQCHGDPLDRRSDLFSLGIVMWEMLTLERLFRRETEIESMKAIVGETVPHPSGFRRDMPPGLDELVMRLLEKDPARRFQTADEVHEAIDGVAVRAGLSLSTSGLSRYVREVFGTRPEPWISIGQSRAAPTSATPLVMPLVTPPVTIDTATDPLAQELGADPVALALATVMNLAPAPGSPPARGSRPSGSLAAPVGFPTLQLRVARDVEARATLELAVPPVPLGSAQMTEPYPLVAVSMMNAAPDEVAAPPAPPPPVAEVATLPFERPPTRPGTRSDITERLVQRGWLWMVALAVCSVVAVVFVVTSTGKAPSRESRAAGSAVVVMRADAAASIAVPTPEVPSVASTRPADAPPPADAATVAPATPEERIAAAAADGRADDLLPACREASSLSSARAATCTRAACVAGAADDARAYYAKVVAERKAVREACRIAGVAVERSRAGGGHKDTTRKQRGSPAPPCTDPFACQH